MEALEPLEEPARQAVLDYVIGRLKIPLKTTETQNRPGTGTAAPPDAKHRAGFFSGKIAAFSG
jgi:hypothetical protein